MARLTSLITGKALAFDTSPLIYYIEQHPQYLQATDDLPPSDGGPAFLTALFIFFSQDISHGYEANASRLESRSKWVSPLAGFG